MQRQMCLPCAWNLEHAALQAACDVKSASAMQSVCGTYSPPSIAPLAMLLCCRSPCPSSPGGNLVPTHAAPPGTSAAKRNWLLLTPANTSCSCWLLQLARLVLPYSDQHGEYTLLWITKLHLDSKARHSHNCLLQHQRLRMRHTRCSATHRLQQADHQQQLLCRYARRATCFYCKLAAACFAQPWSQQKGAC
jgi:hypothetical protein